MNDKMDIQREVIIDVVGTQYEGRTINHQNLMLHQRLVMKHQSNNIHDPNAIIILTVDGKGLGYIPKGYASIYAPAIDSGKYNFAIEVVKTEYDLERPVLMIKIISEYNNISEETVEKCILDFVQNIVNGYTQMKNEYLQFVYSESVDIDELIVALNKVRLIQKLYSLSKAFISERGIEKNDIEFISYKKEELLVRIDEFKTDISDILYKTQKAYNESFDIDDEDEYQKVQSEIREKRKKYRLFADLVNDYYEAVEKYVVIKANSDNKNGIKDEVISDITEEIREKENMAYESQQELDFEEQPNLSEQAFSTWLLTDRLASDTTIKQCILNVHRVEKLYQTIFGVRKNLLGASSTVNAKEMIEMLILKKEFIEANNRRDNNFKRAINLYAQFAGIHIDGLKSSTNKIESQMQDSTSSLNNAVDFDNPNSYTFSKPCSFTLNGVNHIVGSWSELYTKYLILLYADNEYSKILKGLIGKSLYGHRIDFADKTLSHYLRKSIRVSSNFFAEGNLSAIDTIKRIKCLMDLCSISNDNMIIEHSPREKEIENVSIKTDSFQQLSLSDMPEQQELIENTAYSDFSEEAFFSWLINNEGTTINSAKNYISNIHKIENLYSSVFGVKKQLLGISYPDQAKDILENIIHRNEYVDANSRRNNVFNAALRKYSRFVGLLKTVDFNNPNECINYNPCFLSYVGLRQNVKNWKEVYSIILRAIYNNVNYTEILRGLIGKVINRANIDYSDEKHLEVLRNPLHVALDFYAEGDLSTIEIINRIKNIMLLCSIEDNKVVIEYCIYDKNDGTVIFDDEDTHNSFELRLPKEEVITQTKENDEEINSSEITGEGFELSLDPTDTAYIEESNSSLLDINKPFILKDAIIELLSSEVPEINKEKEYRNGMTLSVLQKLLKEYYGEVVGLSKLLNVILNDKAFKFVGQGCYALNPAISWKKNIPAKGTSVVSTSEAIDVLPQESLEESTLTLTIPSVEILHEYKDFSNENSITVDTILDVIKDNSNNLQYEDGFSAYDIKILLANKGVIDTKEVIIEALLSECSELKEIEEGYYLLDDTEKNTLKSETDNFIIPEERDTALDVIINNDSLITETGHIVLCLNGNEIMAYDYSDAINKVCEFAINIKPFRMAHIAGQAIQVHGNSVFYRKAVPVDGYNKLSNGLQIITITTLSDLQTITAAVQKYCQIDDDMIAIISK
ncbi:MAG TPA: HIRAN domain-containing protein [Ruminococcus sp.]|nr:HIRAN domain-containing protein [Ruminococcus sp.]